MSPTISPTTSSPTLEPTPSAYMNALHYNTLNTKAEQDAFIALLTTTQGAEAVVAMALELIELNSQSPTSAPTEAPSPIPTVEPTTPHPPPAPPRYVCMQSLQNVETLTPTWMRCAERCFIARGCTEWAWNMESHRCVIYDTVSILGTEYHRLRAPAEDADTLLRTPYGNNWMGGKRPSDTREWGEDAFKIKNIKLIGLAMEMDALQYYHIEQQRRSRSESIGLLENAATMLRDLEDNPGEYLIYGINNFRSTDDHSTSFVQESVQSMYRSATNQLWQLRPLDYKVDSAERALTVDRECWHSSVHADIVPFNYSSRGAVMHCHVLHSFAAYANCQYKNMPYFTSDVPRIPKWSLEHIDAWSLNLWIRPTQSDTRQNTQLFLSRNATLEFGLPSLTYMGPQRKIACAFKVGTDQLFAELLLDVMFAAEHWNHLALDVNKTALTVHVNGILVAAYTHVPLFSKAVFAELITTSAQMAASKDTFEGFVTDVAVMDNRALTESQVRARLSEILASQSDPCVHNVLLRVDPSGGVAAQLFNPGQDVFENMHSASVAQPERMLADASNPRETTFEWNRADCEVEPLENGARYSLEAVYEQKIKSTIGLHTPIATGTFVPKWLSYCNTTLTPAGGEGVTTELCLASATTPVLWEAVALPHGKWQMVSTANSNVAFAVELELDMETTFPEIYQVHVQQMDTTSLKIFTQNDVHVKLDSDLAVTLFDENSLSCHGFCPVENKNAERGFAMVRRFSNVSVGVLHDAADPRGWVRITPALFTNGSETHTWRTRDCDAAGRHLAGQFVSAFTGNCLIYTGPQNHSAPQFLYRSCSSVDTSLSCWRMSKASEPHERNQNGAVSTASKSRTVSFDDSMLWWHPQVMNPARCFKELFLESDTVTDVTFNLRVAQASEFDESKQIVTPIRLYTYNENPIAFPLCTGSVKDAVEGGHTLPCESECFVRYATHGEARVCNVTYNQVRTVAVCQADCFPTETTWKKADTLHSIDLEMQKRTVGSVIARRVWYASDSSYDRRCIGSHFASKTGGAINLTDSQVQLSSCSSASLTDYFDLVTPAASATNVEAINNGWRFVRSLSHNACLGIGLDGDIAMVSCTATPVTRMLYARHSMVDDGDVSGKPTTIINPLTTESVLAYSTNQARVAVLYYRKVAGGTLRAIVTHNTSTSAQSQHSSNNAVTLVHSNVLQTPNSHEYLLRVQRAKLSTETETITYLLLHNGTIVDRRVRLSVISVPVRINDKNAQRDYISSTIASTLHGVVSRVQMCASRIGVSHVNALDHAQNRFGSGQKFRLTQENRTYILVNKTASDCAALCRNLNFYAARWSSYERRCEMLSSCKRPLNVAEGAINSFNLRKPQLRLFQQRQLHYVRYPEAVSA